MATLPISIPNLEVIKGEINLALTAYNYQKLLQEAENIVFDKENLEQNYAPLKELRKVVTTIENIRKKGKEPYNKGGKVWDEAAKSISTPIEEILAKKGVEYTKIAEEIRADQIRQKQEQERIERIQNRINSFTIEYSGKIASALTDKELVAIEREINLENTRHTVYEEFLGELKLRTDPIRKLLADQKERVRELAKIEKEASIASNSGDDAAFIAAQEQKEILQSHIDHHKSKVQQEALDQAQNAPVSVYVPSVAASVPKARRTVKTWEVVDIELLHKKRPDCTQIIENSKAIDVLFDQYKGQISEEHPEIIVDGVKMFLKRFD